MQTDAADIAGPFIIVDKSTGEVVREISASESEKSKETRRLRKRVRFVKLVISPSNREALANCRQASLSMLVIILSSGIASYDSGRIPPSEHIVREISKSTGYNKNTVDTYLRDLYRNGILVRHDPGVYTLNKSFFVYGR